MRLISDSMLVAVAVAAAAAVVFVFVFAFASVFVSEVQAAPESQRVAADLILKSGEVYTVDAPRTWAQCVAVRDGKIVFVGTDDGGKAWAGPHTKIVDLHHDMVLPGFHDCHIHLAESGLELKQCLLSDCDSAESINQTIRKFVTAHPGKRWIIGSGWQLPLYGLKGPDKAVLDAIIGKTPAFFLSQDAHSAWVNSAALRLAKIDNQTVDPPHGRIERNERGEPTGTLRESAVNLVADIMPKYSFDERLDGLREAQQMANSFGITSIQDAHSTDDILATYSKMQELGQLTVKVVAAMDVDATKDGGQITHLIELRKAHNHGYLRATSAKIFADGVIEAHTAALCSPYSDAPDCAGTLNFSPELLAEIVKGLDREGFQVHVHAIGDRAINEALNAFDSALKENGRSDNRHQIAHLELLKTTDIPRFRELGVLANFESFWAFRDAYIEKCTEPLLGPTRSSHLYQIASLLNSGAVVVGGSDWSVSSMNPLDAIQVAVTRRGLSDSTGQSWQPGECADLERMLAVYTINGAYCNHEEKQTGSIEVDKAADLIVLDKNLFKIPSSQIHEAKVILTLLDGKDVFHKDGALTYCETAVSDRPQ